MHSARDLVHSSRDLAHGSPDFVHSSPNLAHSTRDLAHGTPALVRSSPDLAHSTRDLLHSTRNLAHSSPSLAHSIAPRRRAGRSPRSLWCSSPTGSRHTHCHGRNCCHGRSASPLPGELVIDASAVTPVEITGKKRRRLIKVRAGYAAALTNLAGLTPVMLGRAGIDAAEIKAATDADVEAAKAEELLPAVEKLLEIVKEAAQVNRHKLGAIIADAAQQAKRRAKRDPNGDEILSALEPTITYTGAPAKKAAATRAKKNGASKKPTPGGG